MADPYHRVFDVRVEPMRAFQAFTDPAELEQWFTTSFEGSVDASGGDAASPGGHVHFELLAAEPGKLLQYRQRAASPDAGIDVTVTFESIASGTRITVTNVGFGDSILTSESVRGGLDEAYADLVLYLHYGIPFARHRDLQSDATLGIRTKDSTAGPVVTDLEPGQLAERLGMRVDDLIVQLDKAPVFHGSDIVFFLRQRSAGDEVEIAYVRGAELRRVSGQLDKRDEKVFEHLA